MQNNDQLAIQGYSRSLTFGIIIVKVSSISGPIFAADMGCL